LGLIRLGDGAHLHVRDFNVTEVLVVGVPQAGAAVLLVGWERFHLRSKRHRVAFVVATTPPAGRSSKTVCYLRWDSFSPTGWVPRGWSRTRRFFQKEGEQANFPISASGPRKLLFW